MADDRTGGEIQQWIYYITCRYFFNLAEVT